ncbi:MAG: hypothetical protein OXU29_01455 [Gammaproteobacteria bacterium]|nr:hypothetical protein [Gammaproteobacteria bacterium]MDD9799122.1 hypothetical protein [Gammaproteobacteria bacterium]MDD9871678.1 hypothetical protein [Gammaproteobacteria bacterium]
MGYTKTILCLANSRKEGGRCVAGKEVLSGGRLGNWIRPVSAEGKGEIPQNFRCKDGRRLSGLSVLDIIRIPMAEYVPESFQSENHLIDYSPWEWIRRASWEDAVGAIDLVRGNLWINGYDSRTTHGHNDHVPSSMYGELEDSLLLIKPNKLDIYLRERQIRAEFHFNKKCYNLSVTDPRVEGHCKKHLKDGEHLKLDRLKDALLCISLGEINNSAYKLVATVITPKTAR